jgi:hypothetical protein
MIVRRSVLVSASVGALLVGALGGTAPLVSASPPTISTDETAVDPDGSECFFKLTPPEMVVLPGGAKAVKATLNPSVCTGNALPTDIVVCVTTPDSPGDCKKTPGWSLSEVYVTASRLDGAFVATGKGCWRDLSQFQQECRTTGPLSMTF